MGNYQSILTEVREAGMAQEAIRRLGAEDEQELVQIPRRFWCHWKLPLDEIQYDPEHPSVPLVDDPKHLCCFNHFIGVPERKWETDIGNTEVIPVELTHFNRRMMFNYFKHRKYSKNKCRGDGTTELLTVRWNVFKYGVMNTVKNRKCVIMPGTSSKLSGEISTRIKALCDKIPQIYKGGIIPTAIKPMQFLFETDGRIELTSATPDADRGYENVGDVNQEEVGHWDMIDDTPVFYSTEGVYDKTRCHITHNTTPKKKKGFYYDLIWDEEKANSDFFKHVVNWREVVGLPVEKIEDLYDIGVINDDMIISMRKELVNRYHTDSHYKEWYDTFARYGVKVFWDNEVLIPIEEIVDIPIPLLDINAIVRGSLTDRVHYDQELDNLFTSSQNMALGEFATSDIEPDNLMAQLQAARQYLAKGEQPPKDMVLKTPEQEETNKFDPSEYE